MGMFKGDKKRDFGDVIADAVEKEDVVELRLATGENIEVKVVDASTFSLTARYQVKGTNNFEVRASTINTDQIVSFRVKAKE